MGGIRVRRFQLNRMEDVSGVSGIGTVAEGVQFEDGKVVISWFGKHHSVEVWSTIEDAEKIHGHSGKTVVEWLD